MLKLTTSLALISFFVHFQGQNTLKPIEILGKKYQTDSKTINEGFQIIEGKKNENILLNNQIANKSTNNVRQLMAEVPGLNIWENDGSGIQINVSTRGLNPNRSWEMNTRQNGYDISSDVFGYPEAYYNPPLEAVERIELIRGSASLQYGPQFGGLLNYILKTDKSCKPINFEGNLTTSSYGFISLFTRLSGQKGKWNYSLYNQARKSDGWRENGYYSIRNSYGHVSYQFSQRSKLSIEYTNMDYKMQQSGGLTDQNFESNPQQSFRSRNWFGAPWQIANLKYEHQLDTNFKFQISATGLWGERNSVGNLASANRPDSLNKSTNDFNNRQLDYDRYRNFGIEWRNILNYKIGSSRQDLAFGVRAYTAHTDRNQKGKGTTNLDFDMTELSEKYTTSLDFETKNIAAFAENTFHIGQNLSISPGIRFDWIESSMQGRLNIVNNADINSAGLSSQRNVFLAGLSLQYRIMQHNTIYGSATQAYRPVLFSDLVPSATLDVIDPNLKDASGWNFDIGMRGDIFKLIKYDFSAFLLSYNDRIGSLRLFPNNDPTKSSYQYRTNLGQSQNKGIEASVQLDFSEWLKLDQGFGHFSLHGSGSYIDASYSDFKTYSTSGSAPNQTIVEKNLAGNRVEYVPTWIGNFGITYRYKKIGLNFQGRTTSDVYTDASNTEAPNPEATTGKIGGYTVFDLSSEFKINNHYHLGFGVNNFSNKRYATRRAGGYPGPGLLPGEGRTWYLSIGMKL